MCDNDVQCEKWCDKLQQKIMTMNEDNKWWLGVKVMNGDERLDEQCATMMNNVTRDGNKQWQWMKMTNDFDQQFRPTTAMIDEVELRWQTKVLNDSDDNEDEYRWQCKYIRM